MKTIARAKVNFTLEVLGMRPDGYHDLRSIVMPVSLADEIAIENASETTCTMLWGDGIAPAPIADPEKNLAVKAVRLLQTIAGVKKNAGITISKHIPAGGGLGGGSADAAAVLLALNDMWFCGFSPAELAVYSAAIGSDVPSLVLGGAVLMEGRGEKVSKLDFDIPATPVVLANPRVQSSTPAVFKNSLISRLPEEGEILYNMRHAISSSRAADISAALQNDLCASAMELYPEIAKAVEDLANAAGHPAMMSGSGATVFTLADTDAEAERIAQAMRLKGYLAWKANTCPVM